MLKWIPSARACVHLQWSQSLAHNTCNTFPSSPPAPSCMISDNFLMVFMTIWLGIGYKINCNCPSKINFIPKHDLYFQKHSKPVQNFTLQFLTPSGPKEYEYNDLFKWPLKLYIHNFKSVTIIYKLKVLNHVLSWIFIKIKNQLIKAS